MKYATQERFIEMLIRLSCVAIIGCVIAGCVSSKNPSTNVDGLKQVTLMLNWYPEAEHGGFYAAKELGIFEKHGLDVTIRSGGPNAPVVQELITGRVEFAIGNADDVLLFRQEKAEVVALMAPIQETPRCILVKESSTAKSLKDLSGMRLQANAGRPFVDFMKSEGLLDGVEVVPYGGTIANFISDENTAIQAYSFSEPFLAEQQGVKTRQLMLASAGFNPYASCLITTDSMIEDDRETVRKMTLACCEGWQAYLASPGEVNAVIESANQHGMTAEALDFGAEALQTLCKASGNADAPIGSMTSERWEQLVSQFENLKLIDGVRADQVYTLEFLPGADTE